MGTETKKIPIMLTISVLISNRPQTVRKCLDSIKPILDSIHAELILTDTGCGTEVRKIIEEYTNNIIEFQWCNDFSKARNVGLRKAKGKWFLFLDDDEWFEDVSEIIDFFQSGEYREYGFAVYTQRNYANSEGTQYSDLTVSRMVKLEKDISFQYSIHECFNRIPGKTKVFHSYVHHFGYVYQTKEQQMLHARRNIDLLLEEHKKEPGNLKHILQLAQEYNALHDWSSSLDIAQKGILYDKEKKSTERFCRASLYVNVIDCYMENCEYDKVLVSGKDYLETRKLDILASSIIWGRMAQAYLEHSQYQEVLYAAQQYWHVYKIWQEDKDSFVAFITTVTSDGFEMRNRNIVIAAAVKACLSLKQYKDAKNWLEKIDWLEPNLVVDSDLINRVVDAATETEGENYVAVLQMCKKILSREALEGYVIGCIELRSQQDTRRSVIENLLCYSDLSGESSFFQLLYILKQISYSVQPEQIEESFASLCECYIQECFVTLAEYQIWDEVVKSGVNLEKVIIRIPFICWQEAVKQYCEKKDWEKIERLHLFFASYLQKEEIYWKSWNYYYSWKKIQMEIGQKFPNVQCIPLEQQIEHLKNYAKEGKEFYSFFYQKSILEEKQDMLPIEGQIALAFLHYDQLVTEKKFTEAVKYLKWIKKRIKISDMIIKVCSEWIQIQLKKQEKEQNEFYHLAQTIKQKAEQLIGQKQYTAAKTVLQQLQTILPNDQEVTMLLEQIEEM